MIECANANKMEDMLSGLVYYMILSTGLNVMLAWGNFSHQVNISNLPLI